MTAADDDHVRLCTFFVAELVLGLPVAEVVEVLRGEQLTPVPLAPAAVVGLLNLRGRIVPAVDARLRLGLPTRGADAEQVHVIVDIGGQRASLVVDLEGEVVSVPASLRQDVPETVVPQIRTLLTSAYQRDDALLLVLAPELVLTIA